VAYGQAYEGPPGATRTLPGLFRPRDTGRAMSQENVEIVRQLFDAVARRDSAIVLALYDPEVEWDNTRGPMKGLVERKVYRGYEGVQHWWREAREPWESGWNEVEDLIDAGDQVVSVQTSHVRGRASGIAVELAHFAAVWTIREGKIVRVALYTTRSEALEAAGLAE
jgi:ketosteroid isomerase-like protein